MLRRSPSRAESKDDERGARKGRSPSKMAITSPHLGPLNRTVRSALRGLKLTARIDDALALLDCLSILHNADGR